MTKSTRVASTPCTRCGARVIWATMASNPLRRVPLDYMPAPRGGFELDNAFRGPRYVRPASPASPKWARYRRHRCVS